MNDLILAVCFSVDHTITYMCQFLFNFWWLIPVVHTLFVVLNQAPLTYHKAKYSETFILQQNILEFEVLNSVTLCNVFSTQFELREWCVCTQYLKILLTIYPKSTINTFLFPFQSRRSAKDTRIGNQSSWWSDHSCFLHG